MTHICVDKLTTIGSDNGLSPGRHQTIIWTNAGILSIGHLGTNFSEILIEVKIFSFKKMRLKVSSAKWRPFCLGLNVFKGSPTSPVKSNRQPMANGSSTKSQTFFHVGIIHFISSRKHLVAETKWTQFSRRHFQMHFLEWKSMNFD